MKQTIEECYGTLENGASGRVFCDEKKTDEIIKYVLNSSKPIYGHNSGDHIYILGEKDSNFPEEDLIKTGYIRLVSMSKVTRTIEQEKIWGL